MIIPRTCFYTNYWWIFVGSSGVVFFGGLITIWILRIVRIVLWNKNKISPSSLRPGNVHNQSRSQEYKKLSLYARCQRFAISVSSGYSKLGKISVRMMISC